MPTATVPRADVTVEQVGAVLRRELGSRYKVRPSHMHLWMSMRFQRIPMHAL